MVVKSWIKRVNLTYNRFTVHPFGANFALLKANERFGQEYNVEEQFVIRSFYVDDFLASVPDCKSTITLIDG